MDNASRFITISADKTRELGEQIGKVLKANDIVALIGPLGAGKTTLIQGIAAGLAVKDYVTSPTFIIINEYQGRLPFYHFDLYRLNVLAEIEDLGIEEYFDRGGVCVIEWADKMGKELPAAAETINMQIMPEDEMRELWISSGLAARLKS